MPNYPRIIAYLTVSFTIGVIVYIFTGLFVPFTETPGWIGTAVMVAYGAVYLSVTWSISRRYVRRSATTYWIPYLMALIISIPAMFFVELKEEFALMQNQIMFAIMIVAGAELGAYFGIQYGHRMRQELIEKAQQKQQHGN
ncbi:MAG: hypothetical protein JJU41_11975 [Bacteroidetes bacterium]|nr:hypothetical protein [Bacteroidota bacterium]